LAIRAGAALGARNPARSLARVAADARATIALTTRPIVDMARSVFSATSVPRGLDLVANDKSLLDMTPEPRRFGFVRAGPRLNVVPANTAFSLSRGGQCNESLAGNAANHSSPESL